MIKIIKPGKHPTITCPECECEFSYENEDIQWGTQLEPCKEVVCPFCKKRIDLHKTCQSSPKSAYWINDHCSECGKGIEDLIESREWYENELPNFCPFCGIPIRK